MRALGIAGFALAFAALSACATKSPEAEPSATVRVPDTKFQAPVAPAKTPGQPRLSTLIAQASPPKSPLATYSRYAGSEPSNLVANNITKKSTELQKPIPKIVAVPEQAKPATAASPKQSEPKSTDDEAVVRAVRSTPAPFPRPIAFTPRPTRRPVTEVAALASTLPAPPSILPTSPTIMRLRSPSLGNPLALRDATPTGLPTQPTPEVAIPLGTLPASLGLANLRAAEVALPIADTLEQSGADDSGALGWDAATALLRAGEVEAAIDIGEFEVLMTLCSGRGVITTQPTPGALKAIELPKVICGKTASLTSQ